MGMLSSDVTAGTNGKAIEFNNLRTDVKRGTTDINTASDAATVTFNLDLGAIHQVTITANRILALSNGAVGQRFIIRIIQGGAGSFTVTWFNTIKWPHGVAPTLTTTAGKIDVFGFVCTSSGNYDGFVIGQNL